jgi:hypothetical protein
MSELEMTMKVIGVAGMPGSGKSRIMRQFETAGFHRFDDINVDWNSNIPRCKALMTEGKDVIVSDIMFCKSEWRAKLEQELGCAVHWIFFENNPYRCALNVLHRFFVEKQERNWALEMKYIGDLTQGYAPFGDVRPVPLAGKPEAR